MFSFPREETRRRKWTINCRRDGWVPGPRAELCIEHFEESQFEQHRADNFKKLKPNAVPTLFNVPNPPAVFSSKRIKGRGLPKPGSILDSNQVHQGQASTSNEECNEDLQRRISELEEKNKQLENDLRKKTQLLDNYLSFLSVEQKMVIEKYEKNCKHRWSDEGVIRGLKFRFALGKFGYNFLKSTGYPTPSYSTINRRIRGIQVDFGILHDVLHLLKVKLECLEVSEKHCVISIDEMEISPNYDFDTSARSFVGNVTLESSSHVVGNHYTVLLLRGLKSPWKQIVAHEITGPSTTGSQMKKMMSDTIKAVKDIGLIVEASVSDMGPSNKAMWKSLGVCVSRDSRKTTYTVDGSLDEIHCIADVPHLLKNMRNAFLSKILILPEDICVKESLPSRQISSQHVKDLWSSEICSDSGLRSLHHLNKEHLFPTHFSSMNVATAVQLFSPKTAAALEKAVHLKQISKDALSTAWFIRLVHEWFTIMTARHPKKGITVSNKATKFEFLQTFIHILENMQLGKGWKPLQTGMIMSSLSIINLATKMFMEEYSFFLPGRLTQDALENVFSQIRKKAGYKPTALQAKRALKLICVSEFISDLKNTNYSTDSDVHLLEFAKENQPPIASNIFDKPPSRSVTTTAVDENDIYFMASATLHGILKKKLCSECREAVMTVEDVAEPNVPEHRTLLNNYCDMGGLKKAPSGVYRLCREAEKELQICKQVLLKSEMSIDSAFLSTITERCRNVKLPTCCKLKEKIIDYYLIVRCKGIKKHLMNQNARKSVYSSASAAKKGK